MWGWRWPKKRLPTMPPLLSSDGDAWEMSWWNRNQFIRRPGTLPCSLNLTGKAFRYQKKTHVHEEGNIWKCFEEGEWKWNSQQRFAGKDFVGHYFSLVPSTALAELSHYVNSDCLDQYILMQINGSLLNVLDLTDPINCGHIAEAFNLDSFFSRRRYFIDVFRAAFDILNGGSQASDILGWQAVKLGYTGILFPSLRAQPQSIISALESPLNPVFYKYTLEEMIKRWDRYNLVVFSGATLLSSIDKYLFAERYESDMSKWKANPFFGVDPSLNPYINDEERNDRISEIVWRNDG